MAKNRHAPVIAVLATELTLLAVGGMALFWLAQDIIVKALQFVVPTMVG